MFAFLLLAIAVANAHGKLSKLKEADNFKVPANFINGSKTAASPQTLTCYDQPNGQGEYRIYQDAYIRDLGDFDNRIASCRFTGIYILYDSYDFQVTNVL